MNTTVARVIKRNGQEVEFDKAKIVKAISKANAEVDLIHRMNKSQIEAVADTIEKAAMDATTAMSVEEIQDRVETGIMEMRGYEVAQKYVRYRYKREIARKVNTTDKSILALLGQKNEELKQENSNKNPTINSTQRDYMAGEVSKDLSRRLLLPEDVVKAHDEGIIHFHDMDYFAQPESNCSLINLEDMLQNGTVISGTKIDKPHSFYTACNITTQIIAQVASNQYGGQSFSLAHLAPFVEDSRKKLTHTVKKEMDGIPVTDEQVTKIVDSRLQEEIRSGIQTIQYQLITLMTCNGQAPFVTMFMYLDEVPEGQTRDDLARIIREVLEQRIQGVKNDAGVWVTPAFPKLIYVLDEDNAYAGSKYYDLTELAAKCTAKRMVPDYISAKVMKETKDGDVFPCMGCVDGREVIVYKVNGTVYMESFERAWNRLNKIFDVRDQTPDSIHKYMDCDGVEIFDTKDGFVPCYRLIRNVQSKWTQITLQNGRTIRVTANHPFETENRGVVFAKDLQETDIIKTNRDPVFKVEAETKVVSTDFAWLLGAILCDGCYAGHLSLSIANEGEDDIAEKFADGIRAFFELDTNIVHQNRGVKGVYKDIYAVSDGTFRLQDALSYLTGVFGGKQKIVRRLPSDILTWNHAAKVAFLAGMIDADGYINNSFAANVVQIGSTNKELALGQLYLAQELGMKAYIYENYYRSNARDCIRYRIEFIPTQELVDALVCKKKKQKCVNIIKKRANDSDLSVVRKVEFFNYDAYSYDVTTASEHFEVSGIYSHNCRSFLTSDDGSIGSISGALNYVPGQHKYYGRFNQGVVTINLVDVACTAAKNAEETGVDKFEEFWRVFDERLDLCHKALRCRHERLLGTTSDVAPILWQYGAYARLGKGEKIDKLLYGNYSTISLGYAGLYEMCMRMTGASHTDSRAKDFALSVMQHMNDKCAEWREKEDISYSLYGTPRFCSRGACAVTCNVKTA